MSITKRLGEMIILQEAHLLALIRKYLQYMFANMDIGKFIQGQIDCHYKWMNPLFIMTTTLTSAFLTYHCDDKFAKQHPVRHAIADKILENIETYFIISAICLVFITIIDNINRKSIASMSAELDKLKLITGKISENTKELFNGYFYRLSKSKLSFSSNERITIYLHNGSETLVPFARYSSNPKYSMSGRDSYPINQGCIGKGWEHGWHFENTLTKDNYEQINNDVYNMSTDIVEKLNMKSKLYASIRIDDLSGHPLAIVVVESLEKNKYSEVQIKKILDEHKTYLAEMVTTFEDYIPSPSAAYRIEG